MLVIALVLISVITLRTGFAKAVDDALSVAKLTKSATIAPLKSYSALVDFASKVIQH